MPYNGCMKRIILASKSPRRQELMRTLRLSYEIIPSQYDENLEGKSFSYELIKEVSRNKALDVANRLNDDAIVIGADTVVVLGNEILLKPKDEKDAINELKKLSGKSHIVVTAITVVDVKTKEYYSEATTSVVTFQDLTEAQIKEYVETKKPLDKAGAYGIQELDKSFVKSLEGSKNNVIGLSTSSLKNSLLKIDKSLSLY